MPTDNQLKVTLQKAKHISTHKFDLVVHFANGKKAAELAKIKQELKLIFDQLSKPSLFILPVAIDEVALNKHILAIDQQNPKLLDNFLDKINIFIAFLKEKVLAELLKEEDIGLPSDWNTRTIHALTKIRHKVRGRKKYFKNRGIILDDDPEFKPLETRFKEIRKKYREKLKKDEIQAEAADCITLNGYEIKVHELTEAPIFISLMGEVNQFIEGEIGVV